jgi:transcriptional regulator with XRE-family HTH domain
MSSKRERGDPVTGTTAFGSLLRQCRQAAGLSLRQLAARVGYDHSYLAQVERGQRPGSADLARLCDRELDTAGRLSTTFTQSAGRPTRGTPDSDPLETAWRGLVAHDAPAVDDHLTVPPAALLPDLLRRLPDADPRESAELSLRIAEALTRLGDRSAAKRWWWAARVTADRQGQPQASRVRAAEVISALAERRPLPQLLELADESVALARPAPRSTGCAPQIARALVLAELGRSGEAHRALQELICIGDELLQTASPTPLHERHWAEGRVCTLLGYGVAGCVLLERARELCPDEWIGERARLDLSLAECLVVAGEVPAGLATALRVLVELPTEWHDLFVYDAAVRVLQALPAHAGTTALRDLLAQSPYRSGRSVGAGSSPSGWRG